MVSKKLILENSILIVTLKYSVPKIVSLHLSFQEKKLKLGIVAHSCILSTWEAAEAWPP